jgi:DNA-binding LacI/PurR family transcriptional regulator
MPSTPTPMATERTFGVVRRRAPGHRGLDPFYTELLGGVERVLDQAGAHIVLHIVASLDEELATYRRWSERRMVEAVMLSDLVEDDPRVDACAGLGLPAVLVGGGPRPGHVVINVDNQRSMRDAVRFLVDLGHRTLGRVAGPPTLLHTQARTAAFDAVAAELGVDGWSVTGDYGADSGAERALALLAEHPAITALVFDNDVMAVAALDAVRSLGRAVPGDLSILAWDDSPDCQLAEPSLSVVARDVRAIGSLVGAALLEHSEGDDRFAPPAVIVQRASTARLDRP